MSEAAKDIAPVLDDVIEFMEDALQVKQADESKISQLTVALKKAKEDQERVILEKVAEAKKTFLSRDIIKEAMARLQGMGIIDEKTSGKLEDRFLSDPNAAFPMMVKLAEKLITVPGDGAGIDKEASDGLGGDNDPDGWDEFVSGRPVKVRR